MHGLTLTFAAQMPRKGEKGLQYKVESLNPTLPFFLFGRKMR